MEKKLKASSPGEVERLVRNYGKELKDRVSTIKKEKSPGENEEKDKKDLDSETDPDKKDLNLLNLKNLKS